MKYRFMSFFAPSMWRLAISLPTPREPECSTTHTVSSSSRQTSTKWLPEPSEPDWSIVLRQSLSECSTISGCESRGNHDCVADRVGCVSLAVVALADAGRDRARDRVVQRREVVGEVGGTQVRARGDHPAADVDADCGRHDRAVRRDHRADGRADPDVRVGHQRHVRVDERQLRGEARLVEGVLLDTVGAPYQELLVHLRRAHVSVPIATRWFASANHRSDGGRALFPERDPCAGYWAKFTWSTIAPSVGTLSAAATSTTSGSSAPGR